MTDDPLSLSSNPLDVWRETIVTWTLRFVSVAGLLWFGAALTVAPELRASVFGVVYLTLLFAVWGATLLPRLPLTCRLIVLLAFCYGTALGGLCYAGPAPSSALLCMLVIMLATLQWGRPVGLAAVGLLAVTWSGVTVAWARGLLPPSDARLSLDPHFANIWIRQGIAVVFISVLTALLVNTAIEWLTRHAAAVESAAAAQRVSEARYRELFENSRFGIYRTTPEGRIVTVNPALLAMLGFATFEELAARNLEAEGFAPQHSRRNFKNLMERDGEIRGMESEWRRRDGTAIMVRENARAIRDEAGRVTFYDGTVEDVTEGRRAVAALRESEERFRLVVETIAEVFWVSDLKMGRVIYVSPSYERIWGRAGADLYRSSNQWADSLHPDDRARMVEVARRKQGTDGFDEIYRIVRPDGAVRWIRDRAFPVKDPDGRAARCVGIAEDITERRGLEEQLLHSQRIESIGTLASGVAHDLNNILTPLLMASNMLQEKLTDPADLELISLVETEARRGAVIVNQLLTFGRGAAGQRTPLQPRKLIQELVHMMRETFPRNISIVEEAATDLWVIEADSTQLHQVLLNLCLNARDAMPTGGTLTLRAENMDIDGLRSSQNPWAKGGPHVVLIVSDTGHGIPPDIIDRIFDPFFTTKDVGQGSGLGLSTVHGLVRSYDGFVTVKSQVGRGTTFRVSLPVVANRVPVAEVKAEVRDLPGQGELILVVDDEQSVLAVTRRVLEKKGYRVVAASEGEAALTALRMHANEVRLVITDMMMPGLDGAALVPLLRNLAPSVKIIGVSGLDQHYRAAQLAELGFSEILLKPYELTTLLDAVHRQLLAGNQAPGPAVITDEGQATST
jgi:PAS domain S-box-containing protein